PAICPVPPPSTLFPYTTLFRSFFHADPHPGNIFVSPRPDAAPGEPDWTLTFIDFGMVGRVPDDLRAGLRDLVIAAGLRDSARLVDRKSTRLNSSHVSNSYAVFC